MTKRAAIGQADLERVMTACKRSGYERARIHINVAAQTIDILLGEDAADLPPSENPWDSEFDDDQGDDDYG